MNLNKVCGCPVTDGGGPRAVHVSTRTWQIPRRALSCASTLETNSNYPLFPGVNTLQYVPGCVLQRPHRPQWSLTWPLWSSSTCGLHLDRVIRGTPSAQSVCAANTFTNCTSEIAWLRDQQALSQKAGQPGAVRSFVGRLRHALAPARPPSRTSWRHNAACHLL